MRFASAVSEKPELEEAFVEAAARLSTGLGGVEPDLLVVFVEPRHAAGYARLAAMARAAFPAVTLLGASAGGVIGGGREIEGRVGLSLTGASLPGAELRPLRLPRDVAGRADALGADALLSRLDLPAGSNPAFLLLADPFTADVEPLLAGLDAAFPGAPKIGGVASGARRPGEAALWLGQGLHRDGVVGLALTGNVQVDAVVAQGCRPIGEPFIVTRHEGPLILELDRGRPLDVLRDMVPRLAPRDRELARHSLFLGVQMRDQTGPYDRGDFLVRNLLGMVPDRGGLAVGAHLAPYQVVQFHLRDGQTSDEDLRWHLEAHAATRPEPPAGALLFSCLGRGEGLYGEPDHDSRAFAEAFGPTPLGGFFCNGEIGPVGGSTFLHGYTSCFALFRPRLAS